MKYRLGFVTNSSSSSFIFGRPNKNTTTIDDTCKFIQGLATELIQILDDIDETMYKTPSLRHYSKKCKSNTYMDGYELYNRFYRDKEFEQIVIEEFKKHDIQGITYQDFLWGYFVFREYDWLKRIATYEDYFIVRLVDFRDSNKLYKERVAEMLEWYLPHDTLNDYRKVEWYTDTVYELLDLQDDAPVSELAHQYLGEVALLDDDPCMPNLLYKYLKTKLKYACMHMG